MKGQDHDGGYKEMLWESSLSHAEFLNGTTLLFFSTDAAFLTVFSGCLSWLLALSAYPEISSVLETTVSPMLFFTFCVCFLISLEDACCLQRVCERPRPIPGLISAQYGQWAGVGSGLVWRSLGPSMVQGFTWTSLCDCFEGICDSKELKSSPLLLQAWSPCSLLYPQTCWGFS